MRGARAVAVVWLVAVGPVQGAGGNAEAERAIEEVEARALAWTASAEPVRRAVGARVLAVLASPRWPEARKRLIGDDDATVAAALVDGIAWMGDDDPEAVELLWCRLGQVSSVADSWPVVGALAGIGRSISFARLAVIMPPLRDDGSRNLYRNLRRFFADADLDAYRMIEEEATSRAIAEIVAGTNDVETKRKLFVSRYAWARRTAVSLLDDTERLRDIATAGDDEESAGAAARLLEMRDPEFLRWLDARARRGDFFSGADDSGNPAQLVDWLGAAPILSTEALENLLWGLRVGGRLPWIEPFVIELRARGKLPGSATIVARTEGQPDVILVRAKLGYLTGDAELFSRTLEQGLAASPPERVATELLSPLEGTVRAVPGVALSMAPRMRHALFEVCWRVWEQARDKWRSAFAGRATMRDAVVGSQAAGVLFLAGAFSAGSDFDALWSAWLAEREDPLRRLLLRALVNSPDPRAATLRARLWRDGTAEMRGLVQEAVPFESVLDREVGESLATGFQPARQPLESYPELPLLSMLPLIGPWKGSPPEASGCAELAKEIPGWAIDSLRRATRRQVAEAMLARAGVAADRAVYDRRRTVRHVGWLIEMDRCAGQVQLSAVVERYGGMADQTERWLAYLRAQPTVRYVVPSRLPVTMTAALDEVLDPQAIGSELRRKVDELVERMRRERGYDGIGCGIGYREPERFRDVWDPGFRALGLRAAPHLERHLADPETRVRHAVAVLLWKVFLDAEGPAKLLADWRSGEPEVRQSALQHLARLARADAAPAFVEALDSPDPKIRSAGLAGVERLRLRRALPKVENMVLDTDILVSRTACAVLRHFHGTESWRVLVPLLDLGENDVRSSAALSALEGFRTPEVVRAIVDRLSTLAWQADGTLFFLTAAARDQSDSGTDRDPAAIARWWQDWAARNATRPPADWLHDGVAATVARIRGPEDENWMGRLRMFLGPAVDPRKPAEVADWWKRVGATPYLDLVWSGFERGTRENDGFDSRLLVDLFPDRAPAYLVAVLARIDDGRATQVHEALVGVAGADMGDPGAVVSELRSVVIERWRAWGASRP